MISGGERPDPIVPLALARARRLTGLSMVLERLWPLVLPLLLVVAVFLAVSWAGLFRHVPEAMRLALAFIFAVSAVAAFAPLLWYRAPRAEDIDNRIETTNALAHAPATALADRLAGEGGPFADALWREHQRRMARRLDHVAPDLPKADMPRRDPFALRALAPLALAAAFAFSFGPRGGSVTDVFYPAPGAPAIPARLDAWLSPPAYTRLPPVVLEIADAPGPRAVPAGSVLSLRLSGGSGNETLTFEPRSGEPRAIAAAPDAKGASVFSDTLAADGAWIVRDGNREIGRWPVSVIPDTPPKVHFAGEPKRGAGGAFELSYTVEDDYGAVSGAAELVPAQPAAPGARSLYPVPDIALAMPQKGAKEPKAKTSRDLTRHPFAGATFDIALVVRDAAGNEGRSEKMAATLPERRFTNPLARALIEQRRLLALDANQRRRVLDLMQAITIRPGDTIPVAGHYLGVMTAMTRLKLARSDDDLRGVVDYLWTVATGIEDGDLSDAERRLRQAQEDLKNALDNNAADEEIARLMDELRKAMDALMRELAERAQENPRTAQRDPDTRELRRNDLQRMLDQIERLSKSGQKDKARELLSQLQEMMENLQAGRHDRQQGDSAQNPMRRQMNKLGEIMKRQQELMNETDRMGREGQQGQQQEGRNGQRQGQQGQQGQQGDGGEQQGGRQPGRGNEPGDGFGDLQDRQGELRGQLGQLMDQLGEMGIQPGEGFGEAGKAMDGAGDSLGESDREGAVGEQGRALEALRRGAEDMMRQMQEANQGEQGGSEPGGRRNGSSRDPLGRPEATSGPDFGETVEVPDEIDAERARRILEAIRKRLGDALSPEGEKSYLERLLDLR
jgi:uncharacterized protein (TIGR02302 family)